MAQLFLGLFFSVHVLAQSTVGEWFPNCASLARNVREVYGVDDTDTVCSSKSQIKQIWYSFDFSKIFTHNWQGTPNPNSVDPKVLFAKLNTLIDQKYSRIGGIYIGEQSTFWEDPSTPGTYTDSANKKQTYTRGYSMNTWAEALRNVFTSRGLPAPKIMVAPYSFSASGLRDYNLQKSQFAKHVAKFSSAITHMTWQASNGGNHYPAPYLLDMGKHVVAELTRKGITPLVQHEGAHNDLFTVPWMDCSVLKDMNGAGFKKINTFAFYYMHALFAEYKNCAKGELKNPISSYRILTPVHGSYPDSGGELTNGKSGDINNFYDQEWVGIWGNAELQIDLGALTDVGLVRVTTLRYLGAGIQIPREMTISSSTDGVNFKAVSVSQTPGTVYDMKDAERRAGTLPSTYDNARNADYRNANFLPLNIQARYLRVALKNTDFTFLSEIEVFK